MTEHEAYVAFGLVPDVGSVTVASLVAAAGSVAAAWAAFPTKRDRTGAEPDWARACALAERRQVTILTPADAAYPARLKALASHPLALYVAGDPAALSRDGIALVGTRAATPYGEKMAERFAYDLAEAGQAVYSGLATGIDAAAHRGALAAHGVTVGVLGGALDRFFPSENRTLARRMADNGGAVVSEFPFGHAPDKTTFPQRNRTVAALSRGTLAIEAPHGSGTLITCSFAQKLARPVMTIPANLDSRASAGCWDLYRRGARLVLSAQDVLSACAEETAPADRAAAPNAPRAKGTKRMKAADGAGASERPTAPKPGVAPSDLTLEEGIVLKNLTETGLTADALARACGLPPGTVSAVTVSLRLKGRAKFLPGGRIARLERP